MEFIPAGVSNRIFLFLAFVGTALSIPSFPISYYYAGLQGSGQSLPYPTASSKPVTNSTAAVFKWPDNASAIYTPTPVSRPYFINIESLSTSIPVIPLNGSQPSPTQSVNEATIPTATPNPSCPAKVWYLSPTELWDKTYTGQWLDTWWQARSQSFNTTQNGFVDDFWQDWLPLDSLPNCRDSDDDCEFDCCKIDVNTAMKNNKNLIVQPTVQQVYYVLQSVVNLHWYFSLLKDAIRDSSIFAALAKDNWAYTFYVDKDKFNQVFFKELLNALAVILAIAAVILTGPGALGVVASVAIGVGSNTIGSGVLGGAIYGMKMSTDNTDIKAAQLGGALADSFMNALSNYSSESETLMAGGYVDGGGDIRDYLAHGQFLEQTNYTSTQFAKSATDMMTSTAINWLWKEQKIFILGGAPCGQSTNLGTGPANGSYCMDGRMWYIYYWHEYNDFIDQFGWKKWGNVDYPPGSNQLGQGDYAGITIQNVISASVDAHQAQNDLGGMNYTSEVWANRTLQNYHGDGGLPSPGWEGVFTIPVCNVSGAMSYTGKDDQWTYSIIQDWGPHHTLQWCKPICTNSTGHPDVNTTLTFLADALMNDFDSIYHYCNNPLDTCWIPWSKSCKEGGGIPGSPRGYH